MDNAAFADLMTGAGFVDPLADLWEIALLDTDPEPHDVDPRMEERCEASIAATGDVLMPPPVFDDVEVPGSLWSETAALEDHYRDVHPFPINPTDGEVDW